MFDAIRKWAADSEIANSISTLKQIFICYYRIITPLKVIKTKE